MSTPFQQLKDNFRQLGKDLPADALQTAQSTLQEWVAANAGAIAEKITIFDSIGKFLKISTHR